MAIISGGKGIRPQGTALPIIINGDMAVSQRTTSFAAVGDGVYTLDRYETHKNTDGAVTVTQEALTSGNAYLDGFKTALKCDVTTADGTLAGTQRFFIQQIVEAQNLRSLKYGTANAEKLTLAFWVKATKTGTHIVRLYQYDDDRSVSLSYTVNTTNTWEKKVLSVPADTSGVIDDNNGQGLQIAWAVGAGADFQSGTLATAWAGNTSANDFVGQVNGLDNTNNNFHLTGIQLEVGEFSSTTIPAFQHESFADNLVRCQRYYYLHATGNEKSMGRGGYYSNSQAEFQFYTPVLMRTDPTLEIASGSNYYVVYRNGGSDTIDDFALNAETKKESISLSNNSDASGTAGHAGHFVTNNSSAKVALTAEL